MKDYCLELVAKEDGANAKFNLMREYLQFYILKIMQDEGMFRETAFLGGTALRFLHGLPRYSEDLDFSNTGKPAYIFTALLKKIKGELSLSGYNVEALPAKEKTVNGAFIKFAGLMHEAGISPLKSHKLSIKIEIDTNPPAGATLQTKVVNKFFPVTFLSYDLSSLFAGKFHALLSRKYTKGRDYFDLGWYLSRWKDILPNFILLENALKQTGWNKDFPTQDTWKNFLGEVIQKTDWKTVKQDTERFLEKASDLDVFTKENLLLLLEQ